MFCSVAGGNGVIWPGVWWNRLASDLLCATTALHSTRSAATERWSLQTWIPPGAVVKFSVILVPSANSPQQWTRQNQVLYGYTRINVNSQWSLLLWYCYCTYGATRRRGGRTPRSRTTTRSSASRIHTSVSVRSNFSSVLAASSFQFSFKFWHNSLPGYHVWLRNALKRGLLSWSLSICLLHSRSMPKHWNKL